MTKLAIQKKICLYKVFMTYIIKTKSFLYLNMQRN